MKLKALLPDAITRFGSISEPAFKHACTEMKQYCSSYRQFRIRMAYLIGKNVYDVETRCSWYEIYNVNDGHVRTLFIKALEKTHPNIRRYWYD